MTLFDVILLWLVAKLLGGGKTEPKWPEPKGPTGPTGPTGPGPTGPTGPTGPGPTTQTTWKPYFYLQPDAGAPFGTPYALAAEWHGKGTAWTEIYNYTRSRPLSGTSSSALSGVKDTAVSANWQIGPATKGVWHLPASTIVVRLSSSGIVWLDEESQKAWDAATHIFQPDQLNRTLKATEEKLRSALAGGVSFGTVVSGVLHTTQAGYPVQQQTTVETPDYAAVGDKLLIPWTWPEPTAQAILARLQPIPAGTTLPGVSPGVSGDEDSSTI